MPIDLDSARHPRRHAARLYGRPRTRVRKTKNRTSVVLAPFLASAQATCVLFILETYPVGSDCELIFLPTNPQYKGTWGGVLNLYDQGRKYIIVLFSCAIGRYLGRHVTWDLRFHGVLLLFFWGGACQLNSLTGWLMRLIVLRPGCGERGTLGLYRHEYHSCVAC